MFKIPDGLEFGSRKGQVYEKFMSMTKDKIKVINENEIF